MTRLGLAKTDPPSSSAACTTISAKCLLTFYWASVLPVQTHILMVRKVL